MLKRLLLVILLLTNIAWAQFLDPAVLQYIQRLSTEAATGNLKGVVQLIKDDPDEAERAFYSIMQIGRQFPQAMGHAKPGLNAIAHVFETQLNRDDLSLELKQAGLYQPDPRWAALVEVVEGSSDVILSLKLGNVRHLFAQELGQYEAVALSVAGIHQQAAAVAEEALKTEKDPQMRFDLHMAVAVAGRQGGQPSLSDRHLPEAAVLAAEVDRGLARFAVESLLLERRLQKERLSTKDVLKEHDRIFAYLKTPSVSPPGRSRWAGQAARFWMDYLGRTYYSARGADAGKLQRLIQSDLTQLYRVSGQLMRGTVRTAEDLKRMGPEFGFSVADISLDLAEKCRIAGELERAQSFLDLAENYMVGQYEVALGLDQVAKVLGLKVIPTEGDSSRLMAALKQQRARLALARDIDPANELTAALKFQNSAEKGLGFRGLDSVEWDSLDRLLKLRPQGWSAEGLKLTQTLEARSQELNFRPGVIQALIYRARIRMASGQDDLALQDLRRAVPMIEELSAEYGRGPLPGTKLERSWSSAYSLYAELEVKGESIEQALDLIDRRQQFLESNAVAGRDSELQNRWQQSRSRVRSQQKALVTLGKLPATPRNKERKRLLTQQLADSKAGFEALDRELSQQQPERYRRLAVSPLQLSDVQAVIPSDTAVLLPFPTEKKLYLFLLTKNGHQVRSVNISELELSQLIKSARRRIVGLRDASAQLARAHEALIQPFQTELESFQTVAIIPTGFLHYLPYAAVGKEQPLIKSHRVTILAKPSDFESFKSPGRSLGGQLLAVGNPDGTLPAAGVEAKAVSGLFSGSKLLIGDQATESSLRKLSALKVLHLATHGILDGRDPQASYLVLANDGKLDGEAISQLPLGDARLVTLSACNTAIGETSPGREIASIAEDFWEAGDRGLGIVATLWAVSDDSTQELMTQFYGGLADNKPVGEAFHNAQLKLLESEQYKHPYYWAPFTLWGDWR